jgi:hypothetical protein
MTTPHSRTIDLKLPDPNCFEMDGETLSFNSAQQKLLNLFKILATPKDENVTFDYHKKILMLQMLKTKGDE